MLSNLLAFFGFGAKEPGLLEGLVLKNFEQNREEPFYTFSGAMRAELSARGVRFTPDATTECLLDWEILGGSHLRVKAALKIVDILVQETVREGDPDRQVVDFDIHETIAMNYDKKVLMFFERIAAKLAERFEHRYLHDLGRQVHDPA
jgi:hypothetical protein